MFSPEEFYDTAKKITGGIMQDEDKPVAPMRQRNGHPRFYVLTKAEEDLHDKKNYDYARGGDPLGNFNRVAAIFRLYPHLDLGDPTVVALTYKMKQLDAVLWMKSQGYEGEIEGIKERLGDVSVYSKLEIVLEEQIEAKKRGKHLGDLITRVNEDIEKRR